MSVRALPSARSPIQAIGFNQDGTCVIAATRTGIRVFSTETFTVVRDIALGPVSIASMLYCTSLLAFTGTGDRPPASPRTLTLWNSHSNAAIQNLSFPTPVLSIQLNMQHLVVILESKAMVYAIDTVQPWCTITTPPNPKGIAALTLPAKPALLALPNFPSAGSIAVHDISQREGAVLEITAHQSALACLAWSPDGTLLASASAKGTIIRVHSMPQGTREFTLRRGTTPCRITSMAFSHAGRDPPLLCAASDHGTVHVFRLDASARSARAVARTVRSTVVGSQSPAVSCAGERVAKVELGCKKGTVAAVAVPVAAAGEEERDPNGDKMRLAVVTSEGVLYEYGIEGLQQGGEAHRGVKVVLGLQSVVTA